MAKLCPRLPGDTKHDHNTEATRFLFISTHHQIFISFILVHRGAVASLWEVLPQLLSTLRPILDVHAAALPGT
eukprot:Skav224663  [mRNA]  locus=scaffold3474:155616:159375:- [translate_table: standard]